MRRNKKYSKQVVYIPITCYGLLPWPDDWIPPHPWQSLDPAPAPCPSVAYALRDFHFRSRESRTSLAPLGMDRSGNWCTD